MNDQDKSQKRKERLANELAPMCQGMAELEEARANNERVQEDWQGSDNRFRQLIELIRQVFWIFAPQQYRILYVSPAYEEIWGRTCQSLYEDPRSFLKAVHPEDRKRLATTLEKQLQGADTETEYRIVRPDGAVRWIWDRGFSIRDPAGQVYRVVGLAEDITHHKRQEIQSLVLQSVRKEVWKMRGAQDTEALLDSIRKALKTLEVPFLAFGVNMVDLSHDPPWVRYYDYFEEEGRGKWSIDEDERGNQVVMQVWRSGLPAYRPDLDREDRYQEIPHLQKAYNAAVRCVLDLPFSHGTVAINSLLPNAFSEQHRAFLGELAGVLSEGFQRLEDFQLLERRTQALEREAAERQQVEEVLRTKTDQLTTVTDAMLSFLENRDWQKTSATLLHGALSQTESESGFIGVMVEGPTLRILAHEGIGWDATVNREFYENALKTYREMGYLEFKNFENLFGRVLTTGEVVIANDPAHDPHSTGFPLGHPPLRHFLGVPIFRETEVVGMVGVANRPGGYTFTEQGKIEILARTAGILYDNYRRQEREVALEQQLFQAQKLESIGQLAGGIAHDFNNLLTIISGYSQLLLKNLGADDAGGASVDEILKAAERGGTLVRQLLAFSRRQVIRPAVLDINAVIRDLEKMWRPVVGENIELITTLSSDLGRVRADRGQLEQVLMNLVVNARDAMPQGGTLVIETGNTELDETYSKQRSLVKSGSYILLLVSDTGVGMDAATQERIFEPFFTTKEAGKGTGLGLATVYGIVKQNGGYIWVYSEPGKGTAFKIYLPRIEDKIQPAVGEVILREAMGSSETVLLVEDEEPLCKLMVLILSARGYKVLKASQGEEAMRVSAQYQEPIHLMVSDVVMPGMGIRELQKALKSARPEMKVLYISGYSAQIVQSQGVVQPGTVFLQKPFKAEELLRKVREALETTPPVEE